MLDYVLQKSYQFIILSDGAKQIEGGCGAINEKKFGKEEDIFEKFKYEIQKLKHFTIDIILREEVTENINPKMCRKVFNTFNTLQCNFRLVN